MLVPHDPLSPHPLLQAMLPVAVLTALDDVNELTDPERQHLASKSADALAAHGDDLLYGGKHCAETFTALARGLAALAHQPGGVSFAGLHWCVGSGHLGTRDESPCAAELARERS